MPNENQQTETQLQQCIVTVMTVVKSDEDALELKKKVTEATKDIEGVQINFGLSNVPIRR